VFIGRDPDEYNDLVVMSYEVRKYILNVHLSIHNFQKYSFSTFVIEVRGSPSTYISRGEEVCGRPLLFFVFSFSLVCGVIDG